MRSFGILPFSALLLAGVVSCASQSPNVQIAIPPADGSSAGPGTPTPLPADGPRAGSAAYVSRGRDGCLATCTHGQTCNPKTGRCDELPCAGTCQAWEECIAEHDGDAPRCRMAVVPAHQP